MMDNYLKILEESLQQKLLVMSAIENYNQQQYAIFSAEQVDINKFDEYIAEKDVLIKKLTRLDQGFETLYGNISEQLKGNKEKYAEDIHRLKVLITEVTDRSVTIQAQEARNKKLIEQYFAKEKESIRKGRKASGAAYNYYKNMRATDLTTPQFMDSKQ